MQDSCILAKAHLKSSSTRDDKQHDDAIKHEEKVGTCACDIQPTFCRVRDLYGSNVFAKMFTPCQQRRACMLGVYSFFVRKEVSEAN